jgi:hypothetical protein
MRIIKNNCVLCIYERLVALIHLSNIKSLSIVVPKKKSNINSIQLRCVLNALLHTMTYSTARSVLFISFATFHCFPTTNKLATNSILIDKNIKKISIGC